MSSSSIPKQASPELETPATTESGSITEQLAESEHAPILIAYLRKLVEVLGDAGHTLAEMVGNIMPALKDDSPKSRFSSIRSDLFQVLTGKSSQTRPNNQSHA
jgi:hypothetical protein